MLLSNKFTVKKMREKISKIIEKAYGWGRTWKGNFESAIKMFKQLITRRVGRVLD